MPWPPLRTLGKSNGSDVILRPWNEKWQIWEASKKEPSWELRSENNVDELHVSRGGLIAIPARLVLAVPFWVEAVDRETVQQMALLEVEMKRLASVDRLTTDVVVRVLQQEEGRTFVLAIILPSDIPGESARWEGRAYEPSPLLGSLPQNFIHLCREGNDLVAIVAGENGVIYWETMHWSTDPTEIKTWLNCLRAQLESELGVDIPHKWADWTGRLAELSQGEAIELSDEDLKNGPPVGRGPTTNWKPPGLRKLEGSRRKRTVFLRVGGVIGALVIFALAAAGIAMADLQRLIRSVDKEIAAVEMRADPLRETAVEWQQIRSAVDPRSFPLELLHLVVAAMPPSGVRLTTFETSEDGIMVEGEADNVNSVTRFFNMLKENGTTGIQWEMPPPALLPNNTAKFVISGHQDQTDD